MRPIIVCGNWKMNGLPDEAGPLAAAIAAATDVPDVVRVLCPPFVSLATVRDALAGTGVAVGAQDAHAEPGGAYTGGISAQMLVGLASWCIVGHSERRRDQGETDEVVGRKLVRCLEAGLRPVLCVGEQLDGREAGEQDAVVRRQLAGALAEVDAGRLAAAGLVIAYEPVWAIGTGRTASPEQAQAVHAFIRGEVAAHDATIAGSLPILYGGSVKPGNAASLFGQADVDGGLIGGASLVAADFLAIATAAAA
jgi:triosephosphate isomerase